MEEPKTDSGVSQEDVRELRRQMEDRMAAQGYSREEIDILLHVQPYKANELLMILVGFDNKREAMEEYLADVILMRFSEAKELPHSERMEIAHSMIPEIRKGFIRLFSADEGPAMKAQMPLQSRVAFMTEKERRMWFG